MNKKSTAITPGRKRQKDPQVFLNALQIISATLNAGAGEESRTLDLNLGKVALYQLSYSRLERQDYDRTFSNPPVLRATLLPRSNRARHRLNSIPFSNGNEG